MSIHAALHLLFVCCSDWVWILEFKFNLNLFESSFKGKWKTFLPLSLSSPAQSLSFFFFFSPQPKPAQSFFLFLLSPTGRIPLAAQFPRPSPTPVLPLSLWPVGSARRGRPLPRVRTGLSEEPESDPAPPRSPWARTPRRQVAPIKAPPLRVTPLC